jgi:glycosyltransferase involved in cell wall biosynthesis
MLDGKKKTVHIINDMNKIAGAEQSLLNFINSTDDIVYLISLKRVRDEAALRAKIAKNVTLVPFNIGYYNFCSEIRRLSKIIKSLNPDFVMSWMYHANIISSLSLFLNDNRHKHIWSIHHNFHSLKNESLSTIAAMFVSGLLARLPLKIAYASKTSQLSHKLVLGFAKGSFVLPNIIIGRGARERPERNRLKVGMAARFHPNKGFDLFLGIVARAKAEALPVDFLMCGEGVEFGDNSFTRLADKHNVDARSVAALGKLVDMHQFYDELDLLMCCSEDESFGMVSAEAIANGVPVVSTDVGAARQIIGQDGGIVVTLRSEQSLYSAMVKLLFESDNRDTNQDKRNAAERIMKVYGPITIHDQLHSEIGR